ncbi:MAG: hypothetical protein ACLUKN_15915 [Bacilli bacterium]
MGTDSVRDKDANAAVIMFCEMLAYLKSLDMTVDEYLDSIYLKCGYYLEDLKAYIAVPAGLRKFRRS